MGDYSCFDKSGFRGEMRLKRREEIKVKINVRCYISEKQRNGSVTGEDGGDLE